ncbi:MAG: hypothetical protein JWN02_1751, partial [Acidobacteria bacterium]|nr:hypothetical protein [Acidobacteriota bacterium]
MTIMLDAEERIAAIPDHLVALEGERWSFWRSVCLRGAGFPARWVARVAAPDAALAADRLTNTEAELQRQLDELIVTRRAELSATVDRSARTKLNKALEKLRKGRVPDGLDGAESARQAVANAQTARDEYEQGFRAGVAHASAELAAVAGDDRFRRAVLMQNRDALNIVLRSFDGEVADRGRGSRQRQHEELIASYLQRYCVKNDSIGFFGPVGWIRFAPEIESLAVRPGRDLIAHSGIFFEHWALDTLAATIAARPEVKPWIAPRLRPAFRLEGNRLHHFNGSDPLPPFVALILAACDGVKSARAIAGGVGGLGVRESDVLQVLEQLAARGVIAWAFELPYERHPEHRLRELLGRIGDDELRTSSLQMLGELEAARDRVAATSGDSRQLDTALGQLQDEFSRLTGQAGSRAAGQMYAGRTLVYQDCLRDVDVEIGADVIEAFGQPFSLLMTGLRWLTWRTAALNREALQSLHAELAKSTGSSVVELSRFMAASEGILFGEGEQKERFLVHRAVAEFQEKWEAILQVPEETRRVQYRSEELRDKVDAAFDAPRAGWQLARYHSPDVMVAAESVEAFQRGHYTLVLGEVHAAYNSALANFAMAQLPLREEMQRVVNADLPEGQVWILPSRTWAEATIRTSAAILPEKDRYLEMFGDSIFWGPKLQTLALADMVVDDAPGGLVVRSRDAEVSYDLIEFFGTAFSGHVLNRMKMLRRRTHTPRITVGKLVLYRESWSFPASELAFAEAGSESERFLGARRFMQRHDLPRLVFFRVHVERKPMYLDFESPVFIETFCKCIRRVLASDKPGEPVTISEMLPAP